MSTEKYFAPTYQPNRYVERFGAIPRFGHSDDITMIVKGNDEQTDYSLGLIFIPTLLLSIVFLYGFILLIFQCLGKKVGCLSGRSLIKDKNTFIYRKISKHDSIRVAVLLCGLAALICAGLFTVNGISSFSETVDGIGDGVDDLRQTGDDITISIDELVHIATTTEQSREDLQAIADNGICFIANGLATGEKDNLIDTFDNLLETHVNENVEPISDLLSDQINEINAMTDTLNLLDGEEVTDIKQDVLEELSSLNEGMESLQAEFDSIVINLYDFGVTAVNKSITADIEIIVGASNELIESWNTINDLTGMDVTPITDALEDSINTFESEGEEIYGIMDDLNDATGGSITVQKSLLSAAINDIEEKTSKLLDALDILDSFTNDTVPTLNRAIADGLYELDSSVESVLDSANHYKEMTRYLMIPLFIFVSSLMTGGVLSYFGPTALREYFFVQKWIILPCLSLSTILTTIMAGFCGVILVVNADFCHNSHGSPEAAILGFALESGNLDSLGFEVMYFYMIDGCVGEIGQRAKMKEILEEYDAVAEDMINFRADFLNEQESLEHLCFECLPGTHCPGADGTLSPVIEELDNLLSVSDDLRMTTETALDLSSCEHINSIYVDIIHEGVCTDFVSSFGWAFSTLTWLSGFGLMILTLRAGAFPSLTEDREGMSDEIHPKLDEDTDCSNTSVSMVDPSQLERDMMKSSSMNNEYVTESCEPSFRGNMLDQNTPK